MPAGRRVEMTYDVNGNLTSVAPPTRPAHTYAHNLIDLVTAQSAPEVAGNTRTTTYEYNADQALTKATRPDGAEVLLGYDSAGRLNESNSTDGAAEFEYSGATGQLSAATSDDDEQTAFEYDGPLTQSIESTGTANGSIDFTYDADLRTASITTPGGQTNLAYDNDSLLISAGAMSLTRSSSSGQLTGTSLAGTTSSLTHNTFGEPTVETTTYPSGQYSEQYTRDRLGRITTRTESSAAGTKLYAYTYDPAGRLTEVTLNGDPFRQYTYDANGNRTSVTNQTPSGPETESATYDLQDRQLTSGNYQLTYNANGELTQKTNTTTNETLTLAYKTSGDLKSATASDGTHLTYKYDAFGNRTAELEDGNLKAAYLYAPGISGPVAEVDQSGEEEARFIYATRSHVPDFMVTSGATYRLITDHLGSVRQVVNASTGAVAQEITYDPFGEVISDSNPGFQPFGFAGGLYEPETGLVHFGAREYDAELGRWTSADPIGFGGGDTNLYGYVVQDPMNLIDPNGLYGVGDLWSDAKGTVSEFDDSVRSGASREYLSNYSAGALNTLTFGVSNRLAGVSGKCAGSGYGFGELVPSILAPTRGLKSTGKALEKVLADQKKAQQIVDAFTKLYAPQNGSKVSANWRELIKPFARDAGRIGAFEIGEQVTQEMLEVDQCGC